MRILSIETSCDDTGIAIVEITGKNPETTNIKILANELSSQTDIHKEYGGVFPMLAKREHAKNLIPLFLKALKEAGYKLKQGEENIDFKKEKRIRKILEREPELSLNFIKHAVELSRALNKKKIDMIAVTYGPGLEPALWVGVNFAKALSYILDIPIIPTNHMLGHFFSTLTESINKNKKIKLEKIHYPAMALLVSGGHTEIIYSDRLMSFKKIGETRDDAAGEAFDKVARMIDLPYPGGPEISRLAKKARALSKDTKSDFQFPRPMLNSPDFDFSFSGLKTSVLYSVKKISKITDEIKMTIAKEFEDAVVEVLVYKTLRAAKKYNIKTLVVAGGVSANEHLKRILKKDAKILNLDIKFPTKKLATDNALMIAIAGYFQSLNKKPSQNKTLKPKGNLDL